MSANDLLAVAAVSFFTLVWLLIVEWRLRVLDRRAQNRRGDRLRRWLKFHGGLK